jgi:hypothetical protein
MFALVAARHNAFTEQTAIMNMLYALWCRTFHQRWMRRLAGRTVCSRCGRVVQGRLLEADEHAIYELAKR